MMNVLERLPPSELPTEYLLARVRGRRARLITGWDRIAADPVVRDQFLASRRAPIIREYSPEGVWRSLYGEYRWIYTCMNGELRRSFEPFFFYTELRTVFMALRFLARKERGGREPDLGSSLLSERLKTVLQASPDAESAVGGIERELKGLSPSFGGLGTVLADEGMRGIEKSLVGRYLAYAVARPVHALMGLFFRKLIDARNLRTLYKAVRYGTPLGTGSFVPGGALRESSLRAVSGRGDLFRVAELVRVFGGLASLPPDPSLVETALYGGISRILRREGLDPSGIGTILDYLWRCSLEATNLSVLLATQDLNPGTVSEVLVR